MTSATVPQRMHRYRSRSQKPSGPFPAFLRSTMTRKAHQASASTKKTQNSAMAAVSTPEMDLRYSCVKPTADVRCAVVETGVGSDAGAKEVDSGVAAVKSES